MDDWRLEDLYNQATRQATITELVETDEQTYSDEWNEATWEIRSAYRF